MPFSMIACSLSSIQIATLDHQVFQISFYFFFPCPKRDFTKVQGNPKLFPVSKADSAEAFSTTDSDKGPLPAYSTVSRQAFGQQAHNLQPVLIFVFLKKQNKKHNPTFCGFPFFYLYSEVNLYYLAKSCRRQLQSFLPPV